MHTSLVRIQNLFGFFTTVSFVVGLMIALSSVVLQKEVEDVSINVRNVQVVKGRQHQYYTSKPAELAFIKFDLEADLTPLFNWNTKQIFAYLTASYPAAPTGPGSKYVTNDVVIWDIIIPSKDKAKLKLRNQRAKYNVNDITNKWREQNATLAFGWNIQPHVGALTWKEKGVGQFKFPALKAKGGKGK